MDAAKSVEYKHFPTSPFYGLPNFNLFQHGDEFFLITLREEPG
jgi:hypothetical protein